MPPPIIPSTATALGLESAFEAIAIISTILRLWYRIRIHRFWWDDVWALLATLFSIVPYVLFVIVLVNIRLLLLSLPLAIFFRLGSLTFYTAALWSAKISLAVTLVRLGTRTFETVAKIMTVIFGMCGIALIIQKIFICGTNLKQLPTCHVPLYTGYLELTLDLLGDVWLIGAPFFMLYKMKLPRQHHRLISAIFACGLFATIASVVHGYYVIKDETTLMIILGQIQVALSIVSCNLLVLVTYVYRRMSQEEGTIVRTETPDPSSNGRGVIATQNPLPSQGTQASGATTHYTLTDIESVVGSSGYATSATPSGISRTTNGSKGSTPQPTIAEKLDNLTEGSP
ncbi:hypothetical protein CVT24_011650 [Panaeolus cyanescens]|uniref:Rhodopsin domain-containing protein n=1 Tax=Panaeolus cyanescens TaxID=181874 RepID=A0A409YH48_9AGAR|nr:hypothetical protein CVT24_011650 [Panaeolus cyanescens]